MLSCIYFSFSKSGERCIGFLFEKLKIELLEMLKWFQFVNSTSIGSIFFYLSGRGLWGAYECCALIEVVGLICPCLYFQKM